AGRGAPIHAELVVDRRLPRARHLRHHAGDQPHGQCAPRLARSAHEALAMRVFLAMFSHETNTFSTIRTDRAQFEAHGLRYGGELLEAYRGTGTCLGGMIDTAGARGITLVPSLAATASPAGRVAKEFYGEARDRLLADLHAA